MSTLYTPEFFSAVTDESVRSAAVVVPLVVDLVKPTSVVDVGCGTGAWLAAFRSSGVQRILGIDGDYVDRQALRIPQESFFPADLASGALPDALGHFDLCVSLEVAEHLPASSAPTFVNFLVQLAPVVLFSAAIPGQSGTGHVNERWPHYWAALFAEHGYVQADPLRARLWNDSRITWWYRQNLLLYVDPRAAGHAAGTYLSSSNPTRPDLLLVHADIIQRLEATLQTQRERIAELSTGRGALRSLARSVLRRARRGLAWRPTRGRARSLAI